MQHAGSISHAVEVHKGKAPGRPGELVQHQANVLHGGVLRYGHVQGPLAAENTPKVKNVRMWMISWNARQISVSVKRGFCCVEGHLGVRAGVGFMNT